MNNIGEVIRQRRKDLDLIQETLAGEINAVFCEKNIREANGQLRTVSDTIVSKVERNEREVDDELRRAFEEALGFEEGELDELKFSTKETLEILDEETRTLNELRLEGLLRRAIDKSEIYITRLEKNLSAVGGRGEKKQLSLFLARCYVVNLACQTASLPARRIEYHVSTRLKMLLKIRKYLLENDEEQLYELSLVLPAMVAYTNKNYQEALRFYEEVREKIKDPQILSMLYRDMMLMRAKRQDWFGYNNEVKRAIATFPDIGFEGKAKISEGKAWISVGRRQYEEAHEDLAEAIEFDWNAQRNGERRSQITVAQRRRTEAVLVLSDYATAGDKERVEHILLSAHELLVRGGIERYLGQISSKLAATELHELKPIFRNA